MSLVQLENVDQEAILRALNLDPRDPRTQALLLVCQKYNLDPLLKHVVLISGNAYLTRDGYLAIAHRSGAFDGIEVLGTGADQTHYWARVAIWRKDMSHPFTYVGRFPKSKPMAKEFGPEMAIKTAEVAAMRRAFNVTGVGAADERWDADEVVYAQPPEIAGGGDTTPITSLAEIEATHEVLAGLTDRLKALPRGARDVFRDEAAKFDLPKMSGQPDRWTPELLTLATNLVEELEASEQMRLAQHADAAGVQYAPGEEPFDPEPAA